MSGEPVPSATTPEQSGAIPGLPGTGSRFASGIGLPLMVALLGLFLVSALFWPGYMSWDSAYQWWQARHDQFDATHPPLLSMIWQLTGQVLPGPGGLFLLQLGLLWAALALFVASLPMGPAWRVLLVLGIGLWPPLLGLQVHLWKDLWTLIGFAFAAAALSHDLAHPSRAWRLAALLAIAFACAFRHNAISGALPLLLWISWREIGAWRPLRIIALGVGLTLITLLLAGLPARDARVRQVDQVWSVVTLWDAAAVSLAEERLVFPPLLMQPSLSLDELRGKFVDYSNTTVFELGKLRHSLGRPYSEEERSALYALAWQLPTQHPRAYFAHRLRLSELLFGLDRAGLPMHQVLSPGFTRYADNPPVAQSPNVARDRVLGWLRQCVATPLFSGWIYLLIAALIALLGMRGHLQHSHAGLAALLAMSSLAYALPLALASGSAEFRYLAWPIWATLAALATLLCAQAQTRAARRAV